VAQHAEARVCQDGLSETTRILQRQQLQLEEACRFRDLLVTEGSAASEAELRDAQERVAGARSRFLELKNGHSQLVERANALGRGGFPEVWRTISFHVRGGALLSIESFSNVRLLKAPHIWVGEKDGRSFVLKARRIGEDRKARRAFEKELFILKRLRHPLIMQLEATFQQGDTLYLILPHYVEGTMREWLDRQGGAGHADRGAVKNMCRGVLQALTFLYSNGVVHGDVKLENILVDKSKPVLADFDTSEDRSYFDATQTSAATAPGTLLYMAPELFERGARLSCASDMFSYGICVFLAHFASDVYLAPKATHVQLPADRDANLRSMLETVLSRDSGMRPSADECLAHVWFRQVATERGDEAASTQLELFREMLRLTRASILGFPVRAKIAPDRVVADALALFANLENQTRPLRVQFEGERGSDAGGVTTSLYRRFFGEILPNTTYFERRGAGTYLPASMAPVEAMRAFGISLSRCLFDERVAELPCASAMFKFLFGAACDFGDLESFDEQQARQLKGCCDVRAWRRLG
jgi:serine/threonine protein kinase